MRSLSESDVTQMMGIGYLGEVRQGPDGNLYQYVQGVDGLGHPIGFWRKLKRLARRVVRKALPIAQQFAPFIPGGAAALTAVTPFLKQAGVAGYAGLGVLYQADDGTVYQMQGLTEDEMQGLEDGEIAPMMGAGYLGELRQGQDGLLYQWVEGVDGLGNPIGFWKKVSRWARKAVKYHPVAAALRAARPLVQKALPVAQRVAAAIPGGEAALTAATPILKQAGVAGYNGLGALYQASDGSLYQMQGLADDDDLRGLDEDEELRGLEDDEELRGFAEDEELRGLEQDEEIQGFAEDEELRGLADDDGQGMEGYVRQDGMSGFEAFVPQEPPQTRWHVTPVQAPEVWKPLW